jgi:thiamine biosynthesis lipoprotein
MTSADNALCFDVLTGLLKRASFLFYVLSIGVVLGLTGCDSKPDIINISGAALGTRYHITVVADQPAPDDLAERVEAVLEVIDQSMSTYKSDSEISRFNQLAINTEQQISAEFAQVLTISRSIWQQSAGAFDPTVGPLVDLWGFGPVSTDNVVPSDEQINTALTEIGYQHVRLADDRLSKTQPLRLDLSAVAKGYAVDQIADMLEMLALPDYLVEVGGEMRLSGSNPKGQPWRIAVEQPSLIPQVQQVIEVADTAMATSGDYRNYFESDGVRYSHSIDPRTGRPVSHGLASVTVLAPTCAEADAWATALTILGEEQGMLLAEQLDLAVYMLVKADDGFKAISSNAFAPYLKRSDSPDKQG